MEGDGATHDGDQAAEGVGPSGDEDEVGNVLEEEVLDME
jgi:hypothetical protein